MGKAVRTVFRRRAITVTGEAGVRFRFRPAEYPTLLRGLGRVDGRLRSDWGRLLREDDVILDVGANIGMTVQRFYSILDGRCSVWAFEPMPRNLELLRQNVEALGSERVSVVPSAVGDSDGEVTFCDNLAHGALSRGASTVKVDNQRWPRYWRSFEETTVPMTRLDTFASQHPDLQPTFVKIDVEGAAASVLEGAGETIERHRPVITCEFHSGEERSGVIKPLEAAGYRSVVFTEDEGACWCEPTLTLGHFLHPADPRVAKINPQ